MVNMDQLVAKILRQRAVVPEGRSLLVGVSGIDGGGKGYVAKQIEARLALHSIAAANINADRWLNLPDRRFNAAKPAEHFYKYRNLFDLTIWVDCSFPTALARALARAQEGLSPAETIRAYETIYFPAQKIHFARDNPRETADLIIDNDQTTAVATGRTRLGQRRQGLWLQAAQLQRL